jgi:hypothetical protein
MADPGAEPLLAALTVGLGPGTRAEEAGITVLLSDTRGDDATADVLFLAAARVALAAGEPVDPCAEAAADER